MNEYMDIVEDIQNETIAAKKASERKKVFKQKEVDAQKAEEDARASVHKSAKKSSKKRSKSREREADHA